MTIQEERARQGEQEIASFAMREGRSRQRASSYSSRLPWGRLRTIPQALPFIVAVAGVLLSAGLFAHLRHEEANVHSAVFAAHAADYVSAIRIELRRQIDVLHMLADFAGSTPSPPLETLRTQSRLAIAQHESIVGVAWATPRGERIRAPLALVPDAIAEQDNHAWRPSIEHIAPTRSLDQSEPLPIVFLEARTHELDGEVGRDQMSDASRHDALLRALETGEPAATRLLDLPSQGERSAVIALYLAVRRRGPSALAGTTESTAPLGVVVLFLSIGTAIEEALEGTAAVGHDMYLVDEPGSANERLLYFRPSRLRNSPTQPLRLAKLYNEGALVERWHFLGREWAALFRPLPTFIARHTTPAPYIAFFSSLGLTIAVTLFLYSLKQHAARTVDFALRLADANRSLRSEIRERKKAQMALAHREERYRAIVATISELVWTTDREGNVCLPISDWERFSGQTAEEMRGRGWLAAVHPDDRYLVASSWDNAIRSAQPFALSFRLLHTAGRAKSCLLQVAPVLDESRAVREWIAICSDVTQKLRAEDAIRQNMKLEALATLTGGVAHDFNNLLTIVLANSEVLVGGLDATSPHRFTASLIHQAAERGARLVRHLLAVGRRQDLQPSPVDLNVIIRSSMDLLRRSLGKSIHIRLQLLAEPACVSADRAQIEAAVLNMAVNARDAMPDGGTLTLATSLFEGEPRTVQTETNNRPSQYAVISAADTGTGMSAEVRARALEPFFTTKDVGKGTGLGLSTIDGFARQSGGWLAIESEPGQGTTVSLYLPSVPSAKNP